MISVTFSWTSQGKSEMKETGTPLIKGEHAPWGDVEFPSQEGVKKTQLCDLNSGLVIWGRVQRRDGSLD